MTFANAQEARKISADLYQQLTQVRYNRDMRRMLTNIDRMINDLASLEVEARRTKRSSITDNKRAEIAQAMDHVSKLITIMRLID